MFLVLIAAQVSATPVTVMPRPILTSPVIGTLVPATRKKQMIGDARSLVARAEALQSGYSPAAGQPSKAELDSQIDQIKNDLDSMSEMGEMESLRLQMAMDRMAKMMSTLSNLLKKISDTSQSITQNIK
jgi:hypothetical protein